MHPASPLPDEFATGSFSYAAARNRGIGRGRLRSADLTRPFHGVRAHLEGDRAPGREPGGAREHGGDAPFRREPTDLDTILKRCEQYAPLTGSDRYFSHSTAARLWGCPLPNRAQASDPLHVTTLAPHNAPRGRGIAGHRATATDRVVKRHGFRVSNPVSTWIALANELQVDDLVAIGDYLVLDPVVFAPNDPRPYSTISDLAAAAAESGGRGVRQARQALTQIRPGVESRPETLLRLLLLRARLPEPLINPDIRSTTGRFLGRADLAWPQFRVTAEYDGDHHRTDSRQYDRDISRIDGFIADEWRVVRVRRRGLGTDSDATVRRVRDALVRGGWSP